MLTFQEYYDLLERIKQLEDKCSRLSADSFRLDFLSWLPAIVSGVFMIISLIVLYFIWYLSHNYLDD